MEKICKTCPNPTNSKKSLCDTCFKNQPKKEMPCNMCQTLIPLSKKFLSCKSCFEKSKPIKEKKEMPCNICQAPIPESTKFLSCKSCFEKSKPVKKEKKEKKPFPTFNELLTENRQQKAEIKKLKFEKGVFERKFEIISSGDCLNKCSLCFLKIKPGQTVCSTKSCLLYCYKNCANTVCKNKAFKGEYCEACQNMKDSMN